MKVWITQDCLTKGIRVVDATPVADGTQMQTEERHPREGYQLTYHEGYWHESEEAAVAAAERLKSKKIKSLEDQLSKLRALKFRG